jgi:hypothetical protein
VAMRVLVIRLIGTSAKHAVEQGGVSVTAGADVATLPSVLIVVVTVVHPTPYSGR